jgi:hypothetical protein
MFETVPKLRDERQTFRERQTNDLVRVSNSMLSSLRKRGPGGHGLGETLGFGWESRFSAALRKEAT